MRLSQLATIVIPFVATPASAEIECVGHLVPSVVGGYYKAQVRCTNTEPANQGYKCSGTWKLIAEDDKVYEFIDPVGTVMKGAKDAFKYENDRVGYGGLKIKGQAHPYEGKCEL